MMTEKDVLKIAKLARLDLSENEVKKFTTQLSSILDYVKKLEEVDTTKIAPSSHAVLENANRFQDDDIIDRTLSLQEVLKNALKIKNGYIETKGVFK